jgi:hypothetical protein
MSISSILSAAGSVAKIGGIALGGHLAYRASEKLADKLVDTSVSKAIDAIINAWSRGAGQSLASYGSSLRVEPYTLIDSRLLRLPYTKDVLNIAQRHFSCLYLMAQASDNTIDGIKVSSRIDKFSPDRNLQAATADFLQGRGGKNWLSTESYQFGLPFPNEREGLERFGSYSSEAAMPGKLSDPKDPKAKEEIKKQSVAFATNTAKAIQDVSDLSIGQVIDVNVTNGSQSMVLPIQIRLRTIGMEPVSLAELLALGGEDNSLDARWMRMRVGDLAGWRNLVFQTDRVDRYRRAAVADKSGYLRKAVARDNKALMATALTGEPSVGAASSIAVISKETAREAEELMNGRLSDFATRQSIFDQGLMLLLFVVDADHETVTIYTRDIDNSATYAIRDVKSSSGEAKSDITDIMRSYLEGRIPGRL